MSNLSNFQVDLSNCDREPIHIPGSIQPSGLLFALSEPELIILQVSENIESLLGIAPAEVLQQSFKCIVGEEAFSRLQRQLRGSELEAINPFSLNLHRTHLNITPTAHRGGNRDFGQVHAILHRHDQVLIAEFEPALRGGQRASSSYFYQTQAMLNKLQAAKTVLELSQLAAQEVQRLTEYDRVMVYRFDPNWHGEVIVEQQNNAFKDESYLGMHFPASDIPAQARELYARNWIRLISQVDYTPVALQPRDNQVTQHPLDLSFATYRNVSPIHLEYLRNLGIKASFSISIIADDELWGLIVCHNATPKFIPHNMRTMCEYLGQIVSLQIPLREQNEQDALRLRIEQQLTDVSKQIAIATDCLATLEACGALLLEIFAAQGAFIKIGDSHVSVGIVPTRAQIMTLANWCHAQAQNKILNTHHLAQQYSEATDYQDIASGVLYVPLFADKDEFIVIFRPELPQVINWAGNPNKPVVEGENAVLHPRRSFALWQQEVRGESLPWEWELCRAAQKLQKNLRDKLRSLQIQFLTYHDSLTTLPNRLLLEETLQQRLTTQSQRLILILLKAVADNGDLSDEQIKQTANRLQDSLRADDLLARLSWDEFVLVRHCDGEIEICDAEHIFVDLLLRLNLPLRFRYGTATFPDEAGTLEGLLRHAEKALQLRLVG